MTRLRVGLLALPLLVALTAQAQIYKWTDAQGRVHYGDQPPTDARPGQIAPAPVPLATTTSSSSLPPATDTGVEVIPTRLDAYPVRGLTLEDLGASMQQRAPRDNGEAVWGKTTWTLAWTYTYDNNAGCRVSNAHVKITVTVQMPDWLDRDRAPADLQSRWSAFYRALNTHEEGHRDNGVRAGNDFMRRIGQIGAAADCPTLTASIAALGQSLTTEYQGIDDTYDRTTQHGATQGAVLR